MSFLTMKPPRACIFLLLLFFSVVSEATLAGWLTDKGPQLVLQDPRSGAFNYNFCNGSDSVSFPAGELPTLPSDYAPKLDTGLAGVGWFDAVTTWACLWYQDQNDKLIYARYECDLATGNFHLHESEILDEALPQNTTLHNSTGLSAVLLGAEEGIRLYFHDLDASIHELSFQNPTRWLYGGVVAREPASGMGLAAAASTEKEVTVVAPDSTGRLTALRRGIDESWISSIITTPEEHLPSPSDSEATTQSFQLAIDAAGTHSLFYIGSDKNLHQLSSSSTDLEAWTPINADLSPPIQSEASPVWPQANSPNTDLALSSRRGSSSLRLYYRVSDNSLAELASEDGIWSEADYIPVAPLSAPDSTQLPTPPDAASTPEQPSPTETNPESPDSESEGLSKAAKGIIGASVGVAYITLILAGIFLLHRRQRRGIESRTGGRTSGCGGGGGGGVNGGRSSRSRPRSRNEAFSHVRPYSDFGGLNWEDGSSIAGNTAGSSGEVGEQRKRGWTC